MLKFKSWKKNQTHLMPKFILLLCYLFTGSTDESSEHEGESSEFERSAPEFNRNINFYFEDGEGGEEDLEDLESCTPVGMLTTDPYVSYFVYVFFLNLYLKKFKEYGIWMQFPRKGPLCPA